MTSGSVDLHRPAQTEGASATRPPSYWWRFAHLAALWGYGVSQPVFAMLLGNPEFLVINGASRAEAVTFAIVLTFGPPLAAMAVEVAFGVLSARVSAVAHVLFVWLFGFTAFLQLFALSPSSAWTLIIPAAAAYVGAFAYMRWVSPLVPFALGRATGHRARRFRHGGAARARGRRGCAVDVRGQTPVVVVVLDEFPVSSLMRADGSVDEVRYPGFGRLAREGTWYSRATTVHESRSSPSRRS